MFTTQNRRSPGAICNSLPDKKYHRSVFSFVHFILLSSHSHSALVLLLSSLRWYRCRSLGLMPVMSASCRQCRLGLLFVPRCQIRRLSGCPLTCLPVAELCLPSLILCSPLSRSLALFRFLETNYSVRFGIIHLCGLRIAEIGFRLKKHDDCTTGRSMIVRQSRRRRRRRRRVHKWERDGAGEGSEKGEGVECRRVE